VVAVVSDGSAMSEHNINSAVVFDDSVSGRALHIDNESFGGLRFGSSVDIGSQNLVISGAGATHFHEAITGTGDISLVPYRTPHLVLQADNSTWSGALTVGGETLTFVKSNNALGTGSNAVSSTGTLAWRSHLGAGLIYDTTTHGVSVSGQGAVRQTGIAPVGAIYHDGGLNIFASNITMTGDTWFGARGDRGPSNYGFSGLFISGQITDGGNGYSFTKVGPGAIFLSGKNGWSGPTILSGGVLIDLGETGPSVPYASSNLRFEGGILGLGNFDFNGTMGTAAGNIQWLSGGGGFSAFTQARTVTLNSGAALTAGSANFAGGSSTALAAAKPLMLSSRYSMAPITFTNRINVGNSDRLRVHVERGLSANAYAVLSELSLSGPWNFGTFVKSGPGLLRVENLLLHGNMVSLYGGVFLDMSNTPINFYEMRGGVLGLAKDFTTTEYFRWRYTGGVAAYYNPVTGLRDHLYNPSNVHGGDFYEWGRYGAALDFMLPNEKLIFGHYTADGTVIWDVDLKLGSIGVAATGRRTIQVDFGPAGFGRAAVTFQRGITGNENQGLDIVGDGRMDIRVDNPNLLIPEFRIKGAELRLNKAGRMTGVSRFMISHGGTLTLDNIGDHSSLTGGNYESQRINPKADIYLDAGNLSYFGRSDQGDSIDSIRSISLSKGANTIALRHNAGIYNYTELQLKDLIYVPNTIHGIPTLNLTSGLPIDYGFRGKNRVGLYVEAWNSGYALNDAMKGQRDVIIPWATVNGRDWATRVKNGTTSAHLVAYPSVGSYYSGDESTWVSRHNILVNDQYILKEDRHINSLKMHPKSVLDLNGHSLLIDAGGLLTTNNGGGVSSTITDTRRDGFIYVEKGRPLYIHTYAHLNITGDAAIGSEEIQMDVVKAGNARLILNSRATHHINSLYINSGIVHLRQGTLKTNGLISIGDATGIGEDILWLPANRWDPLQGQNTIRLRGTPYGPGAEYPTYIHGEAILRMGGNTKQHLTGLLIEERGTIDWLGGEVGMANILWVENLLFSDTDARLFMRNWYEFEDILLVRKKGFNSSILSQIHFDGYEDFPVLAVDWDKNYYHITPFDHVAIAPEPMTYGAILGATGLAIWAWRRQARQPCRRRSR